MIAIINTTDEKASYYKDYKLSLYEVRINKEFIAVYFHKREDGLAVCLEKAAQAVREKEG